MRTTPALLLAGLALAATAAAAQAATIPVTTTADTIAADGLCSLREAVFAARLDQAVQGCAAGTQGEDVIQLEAAEYRLAPGGAREDGNESGDLDTGPGSAVRVVGRGAGATVVRGVRDRTFDVPRGATLGLADLTVRGSVAPLAASGGAVRNLGVLTVERVAFADTAAGDAVTSLDGGVPSDPGGSGGAIWSSGRLQVSDTSFTGTRAGNGARGVQIGTISRGGSDGGDGGAVHIEDGSAAFSNITVAGARAGNGADVPDDVPFATGGDGGAGGAISVTGGTATIVNGTFQGNRSGDAGERIFGVFPDRAVAGPGGAVAAVAPGTVTVTFSTFSGNATGTLGPDGPPAAGTSVSGVSVGAAILADAGGACDATASAGPANVVLPGDASCPGAAAAANPLLAPLGGNGGPVPTMVPAAGSPAIDLLVGVPCPATDARGVARPAGAGCDAGAVEVPPSTPVTPAGGGTGGGGGSAGGGTPATAVPVTPALPRTLSGLTVGPSAFRVAGRRPLGTTVTFRLGSAGPVALTVQRTLPGRIRKGRCVAPTRALRTARRCTRTVPLPGSLTVQGTAGTNTIPFSGKLGRRALAPGAYRLVATLAGSEAVVAQAPFRVLPTRRAG